MYSGVHNHIESDCIVVVHKVNQAGSSSKEIGDIDVFDKSGFLYAIEVKDKDFSKYDVEHAATKIIQAGGTQGLFIYGSTVKFDHIQVNARVQKYENDGFMFVINDILKYSKEMLFRIGEYENTILVKTLFEIANSINAKESTKEWIMTNSKKV
jgi:hypothetical protein